MKANQVVGIHDANVFVTPEGYGPAFRAFMVRFSVISPDARLESRRSLLGTAGGAEAPTFTELYSGDWAHPVGVCINRIGKDGSSPQEELEWRVSRSTVFPQ